jgi:hypothetical protein
MTRFGHDPIQNLGHDPKHSFGCRWARPFLREEWNFHLTRHEIFVFEISSENIISNVCSCIIMRMLFNVCEACRRVDKALSLYFLLFFFVQNPQFYSSDMWRPQMATYFSLSCLSLSSRVAMCALFDEQHFSSREYFSTVCPAFS